MEVTQKDGRVVHPHPTCQAKLCGIATSARIVDLTEPHRPRKDLCYGHALAVKRVHKDKLEVTAVWNDLDWDDFDE